MEKLTIQSMRLKNFKGITSFILDPNGQNLTVAGDNATGKTTLMDGFLWVLFGKDSQGKADFQLKPVDQETGLERHNLDTEVELSMELNGKAIILMRRYKEKWTKQRGSASKEHTGHTTDCFVDEVPIPITKFNAKIAEIIDANAFKLVTNPYEFNLLHWTDMRKILLEMCGDVSDQNVINSNTALGTLSDILGDCSIEDHKKKVAAKKKEINKELEQIPVRIDELSSSIQDSAKPDQKIIDQTDGHIIKQREKLRALQSNEALSGKRSELHDINGQISMAGTKAQNQATKLKKPINDAIDQLTADRRTIATKIHSLEDDIQLDQKRNTTTNNALGSLRKQWKVIKTEQPTIKTVCPTCDQDLPEDKIQTARENFNLSNAKKLEDNQKEGKSLKQTSDSRVKSIAESQGKIKALSSKIVSIDTKLEAKGKELKAVYIPVNVDDLDSQKDVLESEIKGLENGSKVQENGCTDKITELQEKLADLQKQEAAFKTSKTSRARIKELGTKEKDLAAAYEKLESEIFLIEQFIITKVNMLEGQINSKFKMARFKLFKEQINGGIEECCETLHNGVPYNHGLNNAARVNVGLDIIATLSEYYGFQAPIFIDNAESVNELTLMDAQVIALAVSLDKELVVGAQDV